MALLEKFLVVKPSTLPDAGKGLFTKKFIPKGERIVEYKGRLTTWKEVEHDHGNAYLFTVHPGHVIDAKRAYNALARYANDARGFTRVKGITNNCIYFRDEDDRVYVEAIKDIPAGSEIFVSYGTEYWKVMRENRRLEREREKVKSGGRVKSAENKKAAVKKKATQKSKPVPKKKQGLNKTAQKKTGVSKTAAKKKTPAKKTKK